MIQEGKTGEKLGQHLKFSFLQVAPETGLVTDLPEVWGVDPSNKSISRLSLNGAPCNGQQVGDTGGAGQGS